MSLIEFDQLPDDSRLWIFGTRDEPRPRQTAELLGAVATFLEGWAAHRSQLDAGFTWTDRRFLHVGVDESATAASGCSIDALVGRLRELEEELGLSLVDSSPVWFRDAFEEETIRCVGRDAFRALGREGTVDGDTVVFDLTVDRVSDVRTGAWERPAAESWHAALLPEEASSRAPGTD